MLRVEYKGPWSKSLAQSSFTDDDNPLYDASPADKVMDPEERPFLRGPGPHRGDLAHPETVRDLLLSFAVHGQHELGHGWRRVVLGLVHVVMRCLSRGTMHP